MRSITLYLLIILLAVPTVAQESFSLQQCLQLGLENNYKLRIVRNEEQIAANNYSLGNAGYLPSLEASAAYTGAHNRVKQDPRDGSPSIETKGVHNQTTQAGVGMSWMVFDGLKIQATYDKLKELQRMGELNTRLTLEDFIAELTAEYYNYVQQNIRLANLKSAVELSRERVRIVEARYSIGSMSRLDLQQSRVDFNADSSKLIRQFEVLHTARVRLNELMALEQVDQMIQLQDTRIVTNGWLNETSLWQQTQSVNTNLLLAEKNKTLSELDYKIAKSRNYPYLKLTGDHGMNLQRLGMGTYEKQRTLGLTYGLSVGFTLFDGFNRKREQKNAKLMIQNRDLLYQQMELGIRADFSNLWNAYDNNLKLLALEEQNLSTAQENHQIAIERYKLGDLSGIELREAQNSLLEAEERLLLAQYNTKICEISLLQISGQITEYLN